MRRRISVLASIALAIARGAAADNTTSGNAYSLAIGGTPSEATVTAGVTDRWYAVGRIIAGRSYCAETQGGVHFDTSASAGNTDTILTVFRSDATTVVGTNDDAFDSEPGTLLLSRVCFIAAVSEMENLVRVEALAGTFNVRVRFVETTLFSNWFFLGGDYSAFTLIRNTTVSAVNYTVNWRNGAGAIVATTSGSLAANGSTFVNGRSFPGAIAALSGTVEIAHGGSPDAIAASTTVMSGGTGLSFDAPFIKRQPW